MRVAVVGAGIAGLGAAYELAKAGVKVCLYEKQEKLAKTFTIDDVDLDLRFMLFNRVTFPNLVELFESLGVETEDSNMSFSVSLNKGLGCEWGTRNGLSSFFAQKRNLLNPYFWKMLCELIKFKDDVLIYLDELENNPDTNPTTTLGSFIMSRGYSELFQRAYLIPICVSIWTCGSQQIMDFPAFSILSYLCSNNMLQLFGGPQWLTVKDKSDCYVNKLTKELVDRGCQIRTDCEVHNVSTSDEGCKLYLGDGSEDVYDRCIVAVPPPDALKILGQQATHDERIILGAFQYSYSDLFLHQDKSLMPLNPATWSALNFLESSDSQVSLTYWLNAMQNIEMGDQPFLLTHNPLDVPKNVLMKWSTGHPIPSIAASKASLKMNNIQGKRRIWFCCAYQGFGFHEDGLKASLIAAQSVLGKNCIVLQNPKQMITSWSETASRIVTTRFLRRFISAGCLIILEDGGGVLTFQGEDSKKCAPKVAIRVHNPQFYWKVYTEADLGLADAYINGDFSLVDTNEGLLKLFMLFIANSDLNSSDSGRPYKKRSWWVPMHYISSIASAKYVYRHFSRQNSLTQARRNISRHYDLSNDIFSIFLGETMTYSSAMFKSVDEDLREAQLRKMCVLIKKARIEKNHEILDIGCGWGTLAIEVVKHTGCKYTGITLSKEQLRFAEQRVKESGFQDRIKLLLCDYRELPHSHKYDRIISCEMIEHVGHEYMEDFFRCCDSVLTENGLFVLQFIAHRDDSYDEYRRGPGFIKEYIFPGGCLPSLSRVTSAMAAASRLCVEEIENIGIQYYQTLRCWRQNFLDQQSKILSLGFDEKFIRTWEYYFDYCAAGFNSRTIHDYQVVFSRPGNVVGYKNPYEGVSSFSCC